MNLETMPRPKSKDLDNDKRLVVYISQDLYLQLEALAKSEDRSVSNFTRNLITKAIEELENKGKD